MSAMNCASCASDTRKRYREVLLRDLMPGDRRDFLATARAPEVVIDAEQGERQGDQGQDELDDSLPAIYEIEHVGLCCGRGQIKKGRTRVRPLLVGGGVDGTRTRDPRRDRPVF